MMNVRLVKQAKDSDDCTRCCGLMVFLYLGAKITKRDIWRKLHVYKWSELRGAFLTDLGKLGLAVGYKATIHHYDWNWWDQATVGAHSNRQKLMTALVKLQGKKKKYTDKVILNKEIGFVKRGGKFTFSYPRLKTIDHFLDNDTPVILGVKGQVFYHDPEQDFEHAVVVVGRNDDRYFLKDPYLNLSSISRDELYLAWVQNNGWMLVMEKVNG